MLACRLLQNAVCLFFGNLALSPVRVYAVWLLLPAGQTNGWSSVRRAVDLNNWESLGERRGGYVLINFATPSAFLTYRVSTQTGFDVLPDGWGVVTT